MVEHYLQHLKNKYPFLNNWPRYNNDFDEKDFKRKYEHYNKSDEKKHEFWMDFMTWFYDNKKSYYYADEYKDSLEHVVQQAFDGKFPDNQNLRKILADKDKVENFMKLYYFSKNIRDIGSILSNQKNGYYFETCKFVNECLRTFSQFRKDYCEGVGLKEKPPGDNTICKELSVFFDRYENNLYGQLIRHNKMSSLAQNPDTAQVRCDLDYSLYYTPFWSMYKTNTSELTVFGTFVFGLIFMAGAYIFLFLLYKFTPLGAIIHPKQRRKVRRMWRNIEREHAEQLYDQDGEGYGYSGPGDENPYEHYASSDENPYEHYASSDEGSTYY
ncbi:PIR Superfamily Protein [Plasmodium ovale curtisi]|uniref:PIR Superfamily Protein n=1 Tax=Plasmodium ovale curtisi TaxID=864141 RepID=A0A1A8WKM2_PLAOA|nr:PIR Superfamily Protein [Plasmodium ovale curtisi]